MGSAMSDDIFGRYEIIRRLNTGGMGEILLARQKGVAGSERTVIIKMILAHLASDPEFVGRFTDESRIAASLSHGNIVQVFESGCWEGRFYMVMEHVDGLDLKEILRRIGPSAPLSRWLPFYIHVLSETAKALAYAYNKRDDSGRPLQVVHRDVSPSNILVSHEGLVKLTDFGVAKATRRTSVTMPGRLHGKVNYMAPEQVRGLECDHRSDVFSLGVVGYEMIAGRRPFEGDSDVAVLEKIRTMNLEPLESAAPGVDPDLAAIVSRALQADPDSRWQSAEEFSAALLAWAHAHGINLMSAGMAGLLREHMSADQAEGDGKPSIDNVLGDAIDEMLRTPAIGVGRTGTISRPVDAPVARPETDSTRTAARGASRTWFLVAGAALFLAGSVLLVSMLVKGTAPVMPTGLNATGHGTTANAVVPAPGTENVSGKPADSRPDRPASQPGPSPAPSVDGNLAANTPNPRIVEPVSPTAVQAATPPALPPVQADASGDHPAKPKPAGQPANRESPPPPPGHLKFRFFPADSRVELDGRPVIVQGNLVEIDLTPGPHTLTIRSNKGALAETRSFNIEPGIPLALGTIELGGNTGP